MLAAGRVTAEVRDERAREQWTVGRVREVRQVHADDEPDLAPWRPQADGDGAVPRPEAEPVRDEREDLPGFAHPERGGLHGVSPPDRRPGADRADGSVHAASAPGTCGRLGAGSCGYPVAMPRPALLPRARPVRPRGRRRRAGRRRVRGRLLDERARAGRPHRERGRAGHPRARSRGDAPDGRGRRRELGGRRRSSRASLPHSSPCPTAPRCCCRRPRRWTGPISPRSA